MPINKREVVVGKCAGGFSGGSAGNGGSRKTRGGGANEWRGSVGDGHGLVVVVLWWWRRRRECGWSRKFGGSRGGGGDRDGDDSCRFGGCSDGGGHLWVLKPCGIINDNCLYGS